MARKTVTHWGWESVENHVKKGEIRLFRRAEDDEKVLQKMSQNRSRAEKAERGPKTGLKIGSKTEPKMARKRSPIGDGNRLIITFFLKKGENLSLSALRRGRKSPPKMSKNRSKKARKI
jgi:hypothetical protein